MFKSWHAGRFSQPSPRPLMLLGHFTNANSRVYMASALGLALFLTPHLFAAVGPSIQIPRIHTPPTLADFSDMEPNPRVASSMLKVTGFIVREPADGTQPSQTTDVYLGYDERNLYAVFVCWDNEREKIRARLPRRTPGLRVRGEPIRHSVGRALDRRLNRHRDGQRFQRLRLLFRHRLALR